MDFTFERKTGHDKRPSAPDLPCGLSGLDALAIPFLEEFGTWPYPAAVLGFSAVFYFYSPDVPPESVIHCIDDYVQRVGGKLTLKGKATSRQEEAEFYPFDLSDYKLPTEQDVFEPPAADKQYSDSWYFLGGGKSEKHPSHYSLSCSYSAAHSWKGFCRMQFCLPMSFVVQKGSAYIRAMLEKWTSLLRPLHGTAGAGFIYALEPVLGAVGSGSVAGYLERFPGLQSDDPLYDLGRLDDGIKGVSWFTMVSDGLLEKIGGRKTLEALGGDFTLWSYPGGVGIMAGETPELGDNEYGLVPHHAVRLHQILRPLYSPGMARLISSPPGDLDVIAFTKAWMFRFDAFCQNPERRISLNASHSPATDVSGLRYLDDVKIPWGTDTTAHNVRPDHVAALIGISGVLYFSHKQTSADAVAYCINDYLGRVQPHLKLYERAGRRYAKMPAAPLRFTGEDIIAFNEKRKPRTAFFFVATSAEKDDLPGHFTLQATFFERGLECVQFTFPVGFLADQPPEYLHAMITGWAERLRPLHGTVGLATILSTYMATANATGGSIYPYLRRYPGLQPDKPMHFSAWLSDGILGVNWYTLVSDGLLEKIGGRQAVAAQLDQRFTAWEYPNGLGIQAGPLPELGDQEKGLMPERYVKLHSILRPLYSQRIKRIADSLPNGMSTDAFDKEWLYRFDGVSGVNGEPRNSEEARTTKR